MCIRNLIYLERDGEFWLRMAERDDDAVVSVDARDSTLTRLPARAGRVEHDTIGYAVSWVRRMDMVEQGLWIVKATIDTPSGRWYVSSRVVSGRSFTAYKS